MSTRKRRAAALLGASLVALMTLTVPAEAHHDTLPRAHWNSPASITVYDRINSAAGQQAVDAWNAATPRFHLTRVAGGNPYDCNRVEGAIIVCLDASFYDGFGSTANYGLDHIGASTMTFSVSHAHSVAMWVHELGHAIGLDHHSEEAGISVMWRAGNDVPLMPTAADLASVSRLYDHQDSAGLVGQPMPGVRKIVRTDVNMALNVAGALTNEGAQVIQYPWSGGYANEKWTIETMGDGTYRIFNLNSQKALTGMSPSIGSNVGQWSWYGTPNQRWYIEARGNGFQFRNKESGGCITPHNYTSATEALIQWNCVGNASQIWGAPPA